MYAEYVFLGVLAVAALIWTYFTLPSDRSSSDNDEEGGIPAGGDSYPVDVPPSVVVDMRDRDQSPSNA